MNRMRWTWVAVGVVFSLALLAGCNSGSNNRSTANARGSVLQEDGPIALSADPSQIVIDLNDSSTPIDPGSDEPYGESDLTALVMDDMGTPQPDVEVVFTTTGGTLQSQGAAVTTDQDGKAADVLRLLQSDPDSVEVTATAAENSRTITVTKTVIPLDSPPVADAGPDQTAECGFPVTLNGSGSSDPDSTEGTNDDIVLYEWLLGDEPLGQGEVIEVELPLGENVVTLRVTDEAGATGTDETQVLVVDTLPPEVEVSLDPSMIWPPNHKMTDVWAQVHATDRCSGPMQLTVALLSVTSNEPPNANGDGNTEPDISDVEVGTEDYHFLVRAERAGGGSGRTYTATYAVTDAEGHETVASGEARVPHDQGH